MQTRQYSARCVAAVFSILVWMAVCGSTPVAHGLETPTPTPPSTPLPCIGDCNQDGQVTIDELLAMVNIALDGVGVSACRAGDANGSGQIEVNEIIDAVNAALGGCSPTPSPTPVFTPSPTGTPASVCGNGRIEMPETCDDGNTVSDDGCRNCRVVPGYTCVREPSFCYILQCGVANPTCSGGPSARSKRTPTPPLGQRMVTPTATAESL